MKITEDISSEYTLFCELWFLSSIYDFALNKVKTPFQLVIMFDALDSQNMTIFAIVCQLLVYELNDG